MNSIHPIADTTDSSSPGLCFHCGDTLPTGKDYAVEIAGLQRPMCCPGCVAVASLIAEGGLSRFYTQRTEFNRRPEPDPSAAPERFAIYDEPALAAQFSEACADQPAAGRDTQLTDVRLLIGGISCAACSWLIETRLGALKGVQRATLNLTQCRLDVRVDLNSTAMSELFAAVAGLGYGVQPWHSSAQQEDARREFRQDLRRLSIAGIGMMQVGMFAIALHAGDLQGISAEYQSLLRYFSLLVTGFVVLFSARGFFSSAWRHLRHGVLVMDLPVALAIGLAFGASAIATFRGDGQVYFDSVVMFTFFLLLARFVEKRLRLRDALSWQDAEQALPDAVQLWRDGDWTRVPRRQLKAGDRVLLRAGETIPIDAEVLDGQSAVREDSFNGESLPRGVHPGDRVFAGTLNTDAALELRATGSYADTRLAALQRSIDAARHDKPAVARLADRIARQFIAAVLLLTTLTALVWLQLDAGRAFWVALSVLVISCPCALSLATPAALASATSLLRKRGIAVNGENALEALAQSTHALFDKTGTLTTGEFKLASIRPLSDGLDADRISGLAAALQRHSNHPLAAAFSDLPAAAGVGNISYRLAAGLEGDYAGQSLRLGSLAFCRERVPDFPDPPESPLYWIGLCNESQPLAWLGLEDRPRSEAKSVLEQLAQRGLRRELLTGDASPRARQLARSLNMELLDTGLSPQQKVARVRSLQQEGATVLMVGDGLNDGPVLKQANVSVAVAGATDLARTQADFVVLDGNLEQLALLHTVALRTRRVIVQNFAWALGYNALGIPLAAIGLVPPWLAALGMSLSSLLVVANAARLRRGCLA